MSRCHSSTTSPPHASQDATHSTTLSTILDLIGSSKKQKAAIRVPHPDGGLQVLRSASPKNQISAVKLNLLLDRLRQNRHAVLDTETFNLTVPQVAAKADKLQPGGGQL